MDTFKGYSSMEAPSDKSSSWRILEEDLKAYKEGCALEEKRADEMENLARRFQEEMVDLNISMSGLKEENSLYKTVLIGSAIINVLLGLLTIYGSYALS